MMKWFARATAAVLFALASAPAGATGTVGIQFPDGATKTYTNVRIDIVRESMAITSADGKGKLIIGKAACTKVGEQLHCLLYDATLQQFGHSLHIPLKNGIVWLNPTTATQQLAMSSTQLPAHGVMLTLESKKGTIVSLTGTVDSLEK